MADAVEIRDRAAEILARPEYEVPEPGPIGRLIGWIGDRIVDVLDWLNGLVTIGPSAGSGGYLIGWVVLAVAAAALAWFLVRVLPRGRLRGRERKRPEVITAERERATREQWLARAADAEASGDFVAAVRCRYRAMTTGLADRRELDPGESVTSGEHLRTFDPSEPRHSTFASATDRYEVTWFGERPAGPDDATLLASIDRELVGGHRRGEARRPAGSGAETPAAGPEADGTGAS